MRRYAGDGEAGFSVEHDHPRNTIRVAAWGFWRPDVANVFVSTVTNDWLATAEVRVLIDATRLVPQREEGQAAWGDLMAALRVPTVQTVAVVVSSTITKMQLLRLAKDRGVQSWVYFPTVQEALAAMDASATRKETPK
jgi:hypothetical protein